MYLFLVFLFLTSLSLCFLVFLKTFPAVSINVSSILGSKFSISTFIFSILFVCNVTLSSVSVYSFSSLLFHINLCGLSSSVQTEIVASSTWVGYFHKILSSIGLWSEKVVKVCTLYSYLERHPRCSYASWKCPVHNPLVENSDLSYPQLNVHLLVPTQLLKSPPIIIRSDSENLAHCSSISWRTLHSFSLVYAEFFGLIYTQAV